MKKIYVLSMGMIDCLGNNPKDCFDNMLKEGDSSLPIDGLDGFRGAPVDKDGLQLPDIDPKALKQMTNAQKLALHAAKQAIDNANLPHSPNVSVVFSTVSNEIEDGEILIPRTYDSLRINPRRAVNRIPDMMPSHIASTWGFMGNAVCIQASCSTGLASIDYAMYMAQQDDYVVVGGSDSGCFRLAMKYFKALGALSDNTKPFDDERNGFLMGEGAGALVLMNEDMVAKYGVTPIAELHPVGRANDAVDLTSPAHDGRGEKLSVQRALDNANNPQIDSVCCHATSTPIGDPIEYDVMKTKIPNTTLWAPKSKIGHTLGAAGVLETIYSILSMQNGVIPHIQNLDTCSFDDANILCRENTSYQSKDKLYTLNNSFGFGGKCLSQVIQVKKKVDK